MENERIANLWQRLQTVSQYTFVANNAAGSQTDWSGQGSGSVAIETGDSEITFIETGIYETPEGKILNTRNRYRWVSEKSEIQIWQLQRGEWVYLLSLEYVSEFEWKTREPHLCVADEYVMDLKVESDALLVTWQIKGPRKNERIEYRYC